jgi:hypothetical protein
MIEPTVNRVKAEYIIVFIVGILILALGISLLYRVVTEELPSGYVSELPYAAVGFTGLGLIIMIMSFPIFIPLKKNPFRRSVACPFCGALVEEDAEVCEKCKHQLNT